MPEESGADERRAGQIEAELPDLERLRGAPLVPALGDAGKHEEQERQRRGDRQDPEGRHAPFPVARGREGGPERDEGRLDEGGGRDREHPEVEGLGPRVRGRRVAAMAHI